MPGGGIWTPHAFPGWVGMGVPWLQRVWVDPDMRKGRVQAAVILQSVACRDGKTLQEFCFMGNKGLYVPMMWTWVQRRLYFAFCQGVWWRPLWRLELLAVL